MFRNSQGTFCRIPKLLQNSQKRRILWYNSHGAHKSVGYCVQSSRGDLCRVPELL